MATPFSRTTRSLSVDSSRYALGALAIAGICLFTWLLWFGLGSVAVYDVSRQARVEVGSAPREISSLSAGRVTDTHLEIGRHVNAGDILVSLDAEGEKLKLAEAEAQLRGIPLKADALRREIGALQGAMAGDARAAHAGVQSARARVKEADASAAFARDLAARQHAESVAGGAAQIDAIKAAADARKAIAARDALSADASKIALDASARGEQNRAQVEALTASLIALQTEQAMMEQTVERLRLEIENRVIRAPISGVIGEIQAVRAGAFVTPGQKLATIVPNGDLLIVARFDPSTSLGRIKPGQPAKLLLDGFSWAQYGAVQAKVIRVASEFRDSGLRVELRVARASSGHLALRHGMTGRVDVQVEAVSPAIMLLRSAGQMLR